MKILFIADIKGWCFSKIGKALQKYGRFNYDIRYGRRSKYRKAFKNTDDYSLILYPVDCRPDYLFKYKPPPNKTVLMIRSDIFKTCKKGRITYYKETKDMSRRVRAFMVANNNLHEYFSDHYSKPTYLAPGGVDTEIFFPPKIRKWGQRCRVGWTGSRDNFGKQARGLGLIEEACRELGYEWCPAYREDRWRSQVEMADYYNNNIDVFIDCADMVGRQNGLLESGACGLPLVTLPIGIGKELIANGAVECERTVESVKAGLERCWKQKIKRSLMLNNYIMSEWPWSVHVKRWEDIFGQLV